MCVRRVDGVLAWLACYDRGNAGSGFLGPHALRMGRFVRARRRDDRAVQADRNLAVSQSTC